MVMNEPDNREQGGDHSEAQAASLSGAVCAHGFCLTLPPTRLLCRPQQLHPGAGPAGLLCYCSSAQVEDRGGDW